MTEQSERLTEAQKRVLSRADKVQWDVPYGNWRLGAERLRRSMCETLLRRGLIERGISIGSSIYYCKLTDAGRAALKSSGGE